MKTLPSRTEVLGELAFQNAFLDAAEKVFGHKN